MALTKVSYSLINGAPVNVLDFGAIGDGVTNDTAAIQAAVNSTADGTVYLPPGTYLVDSIVFPYDTRGFNFVGASMETTILLMNDPTRPVIKIATGTGRNYNTLFSDFAVKANASSSIVDPTQIAIDANGFDGATFRRIQYLSNGALGSVGSMFRTSASPNLTYQQTFDNIYIQGQRGPNVVFATENNGLGVLSNTNIIEIKNCWVYANTNIAIICDMANCTSYSIHNNEFESNANYAIRLGNHGFIHDNWMENQTVAPLLFQNTASVVSASNTFINNYISGFSGVFTLPANCRNNIFINNAGGLYTFAPATSAEAPIVVGGPFPAAPTLTQTFGSAGTLTLVSASLVSKIAGTYRLLYTFAPPTGATSYGFTVTPATGYGITTLNASAYDGANGVPYVSSNFFPSNQFIFTAPNTNLVSFNIQVSVQ
jgi:hypothetical protein